MTVRELFSLYFETCASSLAPRHAGECRRLLDEFAKFLGAERTVAALRAADLILWLAQHPLWRSDWTICRAVRTIKRPFNWAVDAELIDRNPFRSVTHPSGPRGRPMRDDEFRLCLRHSRPEFRRFLLFLRLSGARPGEARILEWSNIDFAAGVARLPLHKTARMRRDRAPRLIVLHPVLVRLLRWIRRRWPEQRHVFANAYGGPWTRNAVDLRMRGLRRRCGLPKDCKLHGLRHAAGTKLAKAGENVATIMAILGHTTPEMALHYIHLSGDVEHIRRAVKRLA